MDKNIWIKKYSIDEILEYLSTIGTNEVINANMKLGIKPKFIYGIRIPELRRIARIPKTYI